MKITTIENYLNQWLIDYCIPRLAENTVRGYRTNIRKHITPYIGSIAIDQLQPSDVQGLYTALLATGLSSTTVLYVHAVLRRAFNCAVRQRILHDNVLYLVYPPRRVRYRGDVLCGADLVRLVSACESTDIYIPVLLGATLGLRRGEILGLKWSDVDFRGNTIQIQRTATFYKDLGMVLSEPKTPTSNRTLLVSNYVMRRLEQQLQSQTCYNPLGLVNIRSLGIPLTSSILNLDFRHIVDSSGFPHIRFHDLRHSNATLMLRNKVPAKIVSGMFGHATVGITLDLYSHVLTDMQEPAVQVIDSLFH